MERKIFMKQWPFPNPIEPSTACWLIKPKTICIYLYKSTLLWDPLLQDTPSTAAPESTSPAETMATSPEDAEPRASSVPLFSDEAPPLPAPSETPEFEEMPVSKMTWMIFWLLSSILQKFRKFTSIFLSRMMSLFKKLKRKARLGSIGSSLLHGWAFPFFHQENMIRQIFWSCCLKAL